MNITRRWPFGALALAIMLVAGAPGAWGHDEKDTPGGNPPEKLGEVNFPVSCNATAQKEFNRAMALFHSFWFDPAKKSFSKVLLLPNDYVSFRFADHIEQLLLFGRRDFKFVQGFLELLGHHVPFFLADVQMSM